MGHAYWEQLLGMKKKDQALQDIWILTNLSIENTVRRRWVSSSWLQTQVADQLQDVGEGDQGQRPVPSGGHVGNTKWIHAEAVDPSYKTLALLPAPGLQDIINELLLVGKIVQLISLYIRVEP